MRSLRSKLQPTFHYYDDKRCIIINIGPHIWLQRIEIIPHQDNKLLWFQISRKQIKKIKLMYLTCKNNGFTQERKFYDHSCRPNYRAPSENSLAFRPWSITIISFHHKDPQIEDTIKPSRLFNNYSLPAVKYLQPGPSYPLWLAQSVSRRWLAAIHGDLIRRLVCVSPR